jgi:hypothetical protein
MDSHRGTLVPSGVYFYELSVNGGSVGVQKFLVAR